MRLVLISVSPEFSNLINKLPSPVKTAIRPSNLLRGSRAVGLLDRPIDQNRTALQNRGLL